MLCTQFEKAELVGVCGVQVWHFMKVTLDELVRTHMKGIGPSDCLSWSRNRLGITSIHVWKALPTLSSQLATMPFRYSLPS